MRQAADKSPSPEPTSPEPTSPEPTSPEPTGTEPLGVELPGSESGGVGRSGDGSPSAELPGLELHGAESPDPKLHNARQSGAESPSAELPSAEPSPEWGGEAAAEFAEDGELELPYWLTGTEEAANTTFVRMVRRLPRLLREAWLLAWRASPGTTLAVVGFQFAAGVASAVGLISVVGVFDGLLREGPTPERVRAAVPSLALLVGAAAVRGVLGSAGAAAHGRLSPRVYEAAEMRLLNLTTRVDLSTFDDPGWRDAMERARDKGIWAAQQVVDQGIELITSLVGLIAVAGVLAVLHPVLLPLLVLAVLPTGWAAVRSARLGYRRMLKLIAVWRRQRMLAELLAAREPAAELRAFTVRRFLLKEVERLLGVATEEEVRVITRQVRTALIGQALSSFATGVTYAVLFWLLWTGRMALAEAGGAAYAINIGIGKLTELAFSANRVYEQGLYFSDFQGFCELSLARAEPKPGRGAPPRFAELRLDDVTFSYPDADSPAVRDVSMTLRRGEIVALVGENGSGKTTLAGLLAGLYRAQRGTVRWDGTDVASFDPETIRERVAVVMQEPTRWPLSARAGDAHDFVMELSRQYDTLLSRHFTDGADLSGGQWQRLAVSRAFYRDAPLLICDEPTANLDARAEHDVYRRLRDLAAGRTVVLITHRMASVREADRIYVLDHGAVVEQGDHAELMAAEGIYAQLFTLQASAYQSEPSGRITCGVAEEGK